MWDNGGYQTSSGLNGINSLLLDQSGKITIGCHDIGDVNKFITRATEVKKATRTRDYFLYPGRVPKIVESHQRKWCSPEIQHQDLKLLYEKLLRMGEMNPNRDELSALIQAWSKVIVPTRVVDHTQTYELEIGDIVYLDYVTPDEYQVRRLTSVIDQLGDVFEPPEWQQTWNQCPCKEVARDDITRYTFLSSEGSYPGVSFDNIRFLQADVAAIWFLEHIMRVSKDYDVPADLVCLVTGVGHHANTSIKLEKGSADVYFYRGAMPKVPEDINDKSWGHWSLNEDFLAPAPTFEELMENFSTPHFRIHPSFEMISLSAIEAEFLQRITLGSH